MLRNNFYTLWHNNYSTTAIPRVDFSFRFISKSRIISCQLYVLTCREPGNEPKPISKLNVKQKPVLLLPSQSPRMRHSISAADWIPLRTLIYHCCSHICGLTVQMTPFVSFTLPETGIWPKYSVMTLYFSLFIFLCYENVFLL